MNRLSKLLVATAAGAALSFAAAASSQAAVYIKIVTNLQTITSGAITPAADGGFNFLATGSGNAASALGLGGYNSISITGGAPKKPALHSETTELNASGPASATIYITRTDLNRPFSELLTTFNYSVVGTGWNVVSSSYVNMSNGLYGGTLLKTKSFSGTLAQSFNASDAFLNPTFNNYSFTEKFVVTATGASSAQAAATLVAVPEPATWALMIGGFGAAGAMIRRRKVALAA